MIKFQMGPLSFISESHLSGRFGLFGKYRGKVAPVDDISEDVDIEAGENAAVTKPTPCDADEVQEMHHSLPNSTQ